MIELAPSHKRGLALAGPLMNVAGVMGFADEYRRLVDLAAPGAFVTNPLTAAPRTPAGGLRALEYPGGALIHTGLPNPGVRRAIRRYGRKWAAFPCPVIVHLAPANPAEASECLSLLEAVEGVAGIELGLRDGTLPGQAEALTAAAAAGGGLPVLVRLPFPAAREVALAARRAGAAALTVCAPPRGALPGPSGQPVAGRLFSRAFFPLTLHAVNAITRAAGLPVIASGGIFNAAAARALLAAGAVAVQVDALVWRNPGALAELAASLSA